LKNKIKSLEKLNRNNFGLNWFGRGKKPNRTEINQFESVFSSARFKNLKKKFGLVVYFGLKPAQTENIQP
jgi:hypothetical protein